MRQVRQLVSLARTPVLTLILTLSSHPHPEHIPIQPGIGRGGKSATNPSQRTRIAAPAPPGTGGKNKTAFVRTEIFFLRLIGKIADDDDFCVAVFKKEFRPPREEKEGEKEEQVVLDRDAVFPPDLDWFWKTNRWN